MSIEYVLIVNDGQSGGLMSLCFDVISQIEGVKCEICDELVSGRWEGRPHTEWANDFEVWFEEGGIQVAFHSATKEQRLGVLNVIRDGILKKGMSVGSFEEL